MAEFFVPKTGLQAYDLSRAYGLGVTVDAVGGNAVMADRGYYFVISGGEPDMRRLPDLQYFLGDDLPWTEPLITLQRQAQAEAKAARDRLSDPKVISRLLDAHRSLEVRHAGDQETLYHAMEPAAAKGVRDEVIGRTYSEGSQLRVPSGEWLLSLLGHANASTWSFAESERLCVIPAPEHLPIRYLKDLRAAMREVRRISAAGAEVTVADRSVRLFRKAVESQDDLFRRRARFEHMLFYSLSKTANQWKPKGLAAYPLELVNRLVYSGDAATASHVLDVWGKVLRAGSRKGWEPLAHTLARAIGDPGLNSWQRYVSTHLRFVKRHAFHVYYEEDALSEMLKWLKT